MRILAFLIPLISFSASAERIEYLKLCLQDLEVAEDGETYDPTSCRKAAELGSPEAHYVMGMHYSRIEDWDQSVFHYQAAADGGFVWGHMGLGHSYITKNAVKSEHHYRILAESEDEMAIMALSFIGDLRARKGRSLQAYSWFYACAQFETYAKAHCEAKMRSQQPHLSKLQVDHAIEDAQEIIEWFSDNNAFNTDAD